MYAEESLLLIESINAVVDNIVIFVNDAIYWSSLFNITVNIPNRSIPKQTQLFYGADYNPDQWQHAPEILERDIELMKQAGVTSASVGIFAWTDGRRYEARKQVPCTQVATKLQPTSDIRQPGLLIGGLGETLIWRIFRPI